jgi:hypothetical protein
MEYLRSNAQEIVNFLKYLYIVFILALIVIVAIELKHIYQIDLFPLVDTPIDNIYYEIKDDYLKV